jgi:hypothetical protein
MRATQHDGGCSSDTYTYEPVKIFMTLQNYGFAEKIDLTFSGSTSLPNGALYTSPDSLSANLSGATNSFTWTAGGEIWRWIGYCTKGSSDQNERTAAGTITATQLTLTYGGKTFTVSLATPITLNNPN